MRSVLLGVLGSILLTSVSIAQEAHPIHITDQLMRQPEALRAATSFQELKKRGIDLWARKTAQAYVIGEKRVFRVRDIAAEETQPAPVFREAEFTLKAEEERFLLWVETAELNNQHVREQDITALASALANQTPAGSVNTNEGIIVNDEAIFGRPPDVDGTGKSDILLTDVRDNYSGEGYVAGFVDPLDVLCLNPTTQRCTPGNMRDILYLDTTPGLFREGQYRVERVLPTAAHEYQHLIHLAYDPEEIAFVNEGLSEFAEVVNGYQSRPITYLSSPERYNVPLFRWSSGLEQDVMDDYERAGLFTNYIGDRFSFATAGNLTRTTTTHADDAYESILSGTGVTFEQLLLDFHTANYLNTEVMQGSSLLGYKTPQRKGIRAQPSMTFDGHTATSAPVTRDTVSSGAVQYIVWNNVERFTLNIDVTAAELAQTAILRARMRLRLILEPISGSRTIQDLSPQTNSQSFTGAFSRITLVVAHVQPEEPAVLPFQYSASWSSQQTAREETIVYDNGVTPSEPGENNTVTLEAYSLGAGARMANRFVVPKGSTLSRVAVAPYYESQFGSMDDASIRNFRLHVWNDNNGVPGTEIFATDFTDPRLSNTATLNFYTIDLAAYRQQLSNLPGTVFVGLSNTGTDANYIVMGVTEGQSDENSFVFSSTSQVWRAFPDVRGNDGSAILQNRVLPIRATFLIPTTPVASEDPTSPVVLALEQNYPNPFGRETLITYRLPAPGSVFLEVYDALGRRVATLVEGTLEAGTHTARFEAEGLSSGIYFYRLRAGDKVLSRQMVVVH